MIVMRCSAWLCDLEHKNFDKSRILVCNEVSYSVKEYERGKFEGAWGGIPDPTFIHFMSMGGGTEFPE